MTVLSFLKSHRAELLEIAQQHGAYHLQVFGSVARGEEQAESDVDILAEFESGRSLLDESRLIQALEAFISRKIDLVDPTCLQSDIRNRILQEAIRL